MFGALLSIQILMKTGKCGLKMIVLDVRWEYSKKKEKKELNWINRIPKIAVMYKNLELETFLSKFFN